MFCRRGPAASMNLPMAPLTRRQLLLPALAGLGCAALSAIPAQAHGNAGADVAAGLAHPLVGVDHLLLWLGLGALASLAGNRWLLWGGAGAAVGAVLGHLGMTIPFAEPVASLALTVLGMLLLALLNPGSRFGLLHGAEGSGGGAWWLGLLVSSLGLVTIGRLGFPRLAGRWQLWAAIALSLSGVAFSGLALN
jgi:urease accessory protein